GRSIFRQGQILFKWYCRQYSRVLKCFTRFYVQNEVSKQLLGTIGITDVQIVGDTRFDRVLQIKAAAKQLPIVEAFIGGKKTFVAGSSWQPDEEIFIPFFNEHRDWKLVLAPHVISEDHLQQIEKLLAGRRVVRYTQATEDNVRDAEVLIIDCFGLLSSIYHYADVTYVGGGFGVGIHNTLEAAVWDVPVFFGPNNQRFQEAQGLKQCGGGLEIASADDFRRLMQGFVDQPILAKELGEKAGAYVKSMTGATQKILADIKL
ncbi:MAG: 3-deoxy-D-manno-octulosonic acid transferase, partial [Prevotella sp.]|nr:3-deoxy-D-manno-octulosonic acid transferase [Prevotella sp.]